MKKRYIVPVLLVLPFSISATVKKEYQIEKEQKILSEPKVLILNSQNQDAKQGLEGRTQISSQPVVQVQGTPISTTYAMELKKSRKEAEFQTEQKIVEKLESSRLRDEQERIKKLFGEVPKKTTVVTTPTPTSHKPVLLPDSSEVYTEVSSIEDKNVSKDSVYAGIQAGQASNLTTLKQGSVRSYGSFGLSFGAVAESGMILESNFLYANHKFFGTLYANTSEAVITHHVHQLTGMLSLKYTPVSYRFLPYIGASLHYNHWIYNHHSCSGLSIQSPCKGQASTDSLDLGAVAGMDFKLNSKISIGFNMFINVLNLTNNHQKLVEKGYYLNDVSSSYQYRNTEVKLEETNWLIASINAKLYF